MSRKTTLVLVGIFGLLVLYVIFVQRPKEEAAKNATPTPGQGGSVWTLTADQLMGVRIVDRASSRNVAISKDAQGIWIVTEPAPGQADQTVVSNAVNQLVNLSFTSALSPTDSLEVYGVLSPTYSLELSLSDGSTRKAIIGDKSPTGAGYYVQREGETSVLVVPSYSIEALTALIATPPYFVPTPTVTPTVDLVSTLLVPTLTPTPGTNATARPPTPTPAAGTPADSETPDSYATP